MKKLEDMTPNELRKLADEKENEEWVEIKEGFLKEDIYSMNCLNDYLKYNTKIDINFITETEKRKIERDFDQFEKLLKKGTRFLCYDFKEEGQLWFDDVNCGIEEQSNDWAEKYLENIRKLQKEKK